MGRRVRGVCVLNCERSQENARIILRFAWRAAEQLFRRARVLLNGGNAHQSASGPPDLLTLGAALKQKPRAPSLPLNN